MNTLIGFGGALPIIAIFLFVFRSQLSKFQKIVATLLIYILSLVTGIVSDVVWGFGDTESALLAGLGTPIVLCIIFALTTLSLRSRRGPSIPQPISTLTNVETSANSEEIATENQYRRIDSPEPQPKPPNLPEVQGKKSANSALAWAVIRIVVGIAVIFVHTLVGGKASIISFAIGGWLVGGGGFDLYNLLKKQKRVEAVKHVDHGTNLSSEPDANKYDEDNESSDTYVCADCGYRIRKFDLRNELFCPECNGRLQEL